MSEETLQNQNTSTKYLQGPNVPGYWMNETSGVLKPAIEAYIQSDPLSDAQVAAIRAYLRQWIDAPVWRGDGISFLRKEIDGLTSRDAIDRWLSAALNAGIDPL